MSDVADPGVDAATTLGSFGAAPYALLTLYDPALRPDADLFALAAPFDFTPAEARVAVRIANGLSLKDAAHDRSLSRWTVRSQMDALSGKSETQRQPDLVRVLLLAEKL